MISNITQAFTKFNEKFDPTFSLVGQGAWETKFPESCSSQAFQGCKEERERIQAAR